MTDSSDDVPDNDPRALASMVVGATFLSTAAPWVRLADVGPSTAGFYRMVVGTVALATFCTVGGRRLWRGPRYALRFLPVGLFFAADLFLWHRCIPVVGPGLATILANMQVFAMAAVGAIVYGEEPGWRFALGLALALPGLVVLVGVDPDALDPNYLTGVALGLGAALSYAGYLVTLRRAQGVDDALDPAANLTYATGWCGLLLFGLVFVEGSSLAVPNVETGGALLAYGLFCQVGGWIFITGAMPQLAASLVGLLLLLQPGLAMIWDVLFFARPARWTDLGGAALVLGGIYLGILDRRT